MIRRSLLRGAAGAAATPLLSPFARAQAFPSKPITIVAPVQPGGILDMSARMVSEPLGKLLNTSVIVDNRPGGNATVGYNAVLRAPADGHTLLCTSFWHVLNPSLIKNLTWSQKDFVPVANLTASTNVITVHPSVPANTLQELFAYAKANPGKLSYADNGGIGSPAHIGTEMLKDITGTNIVHIPFKGSGAAIANLLSGDVHMFMTSPPSVLQHVQAGKLRALAVTGKKRHPGLPNVPTTAEAGLKFELETWVALFASAGTPPAIVATLTSNIQKALETREVRQRAEAQGVDVSYLSPPDLDAVIKRETAEGAAIIRKLKISLDN
ncbi:Bug family tripartite tricarboxylate transporter substrate binding protein [Ramlibacter sp.]|uniref:Bug family tripartite tricarboxylate transporter substrate binding protein n=1 Tax=Ramlibacter sp. TaxID=1917967 RepID=UPI003D152782